LESIMTSSSRARGRRALVLGGLSFVLAAAACAARDGESRVERVASALSREVAEGGLQEGGQDASSDGGADAGESATARWVRRDGIAAHREFPAGCALSWGDFLVFGGRVTLDGPGSAVDTDELLTYSNGAWSPNRGARPSARFGAAMVQDADRNVLVFGGAQTRPNGSTTLGDTWLRDGQEVFRLASLPVAPPPRVFGQMVTDTQRGRVVLFGGLADAEGQTPLRDTWFWQNGRWTAFTGTAPEASGVPTLTIDEERGTVVLAMWDRQTTSLRLFELHDTGWTERGSASTMRDTFDGRIFFDRSRRALIFMTDASAVYVQTATGWLREMANAWGRVGAYTPAGVLDYAGTIASFAGWEWEKSGDALRGWRAGTGRVLAYVHPGQRTAHALASTGWGGILFGGHDGNELRDDTWVFASGVWTQKRSDPSPRARQNHAMAYDARTGNVVLFGGEFCDFASCTQLDDMWTWNGAIWMPIAKNGPWPSARAKHGLAYDVARRKMVLAGPFDSSTWEWDGAQWTEIHAASPNGVSLTLTYDTKRQQVVAVSDGSASFSSIHAETPVRVSTWDGATWSLLASRTDLTPLTYAATTFDPGRNRLVVSSGWTDACCSSGIPWPAGMDTELTYDLGAQGWQPFVSARTPPIRVGAKMFYGAGTGVVLYGGRLPESSELRLDTWAVVPTKQPNGQACGGPGECTSGFCVDGMCCDVQCSGDSTDRCMACSVAAGAPVDGVCAPKALGSVCQESSSWCSGTGKCSGSAAAPTCRIDLHEKDGQSCHEGACSAGACVPTGDGGVDGGNSDGGVDAAADPGDAAIEDAASDAGRFDAASAVDAAADAADVAPPPLPDMPSDGGCGCKTAPSRSDGAGMIALALFVRGAALRRRSARGAR
jgi:hypothetical protein